MDTTAGPNLHNVPTDKDAHNLKSQLNQNQCSNFATGNAKIPKIGRVLKLFTVFRLIPFQWNCKESQLSQCRSWHLILWLFAGPFLSSIQTCFLAVQVLRTSVLLSERHLWADVKYLGIFTQLVSTFFTVLVFTAYQIHVMFHREDIVKYLTEITRYRKILVGKNFPLRKDVKIATFIVMLLTVRVKIVISSAISHRMSPFHLYSVLPAHWQSEPVCFRIYFGLYSAFSFVSWVALIFQVFLVCLYIDTMEVAMERTLTVYKTDRSFHKKLVWRTYMEWRLYSRLYENAVSRRIIPIYLASCAVIMTLAGFGLVRFFGKIVPKLYFSFLSPFLGMNAMTYFVLKPSVRIHEMSVEFKRQISFGTAGDNAIMNNGVIIIRNKNLYKCRIRSLPDISVNAGSLFGIKRTTYITLLGITTVNAISLLINF